MYSPRGRLSDLPPLQPFGWISNDNFQAVPELAEVVRGISRRQDLDLPYPAKASSSRRQQIFDANERRLHLSSALLDPRLATGAKTSLLTFLDADGHPGRRSPHRSTFTTKGSSVGVAAPYHQ
jgi:hypothetical protein